MKPEVDAFIKVFVKDLTESNVAIFAGAGMSRAAGYVDWVGLLKEIAEDLGLDVGAESKDLISLAQFHVNEKGGRARINATILSEFTEDAEESENHRILARLPITTYWTTNYDNLIEDALEAAFKRADVKHEVEQLANTKPRRDSVVYKMHGDAEHPSKATITKQDYQAYYKSNEAFVTALSGDLVSKTFLFIGFSFNDPNLEYVLGRLNIQFGENAKHHYWFVREVQRKSYEEGEQGDKQFEYDKRRQDLMIGDLRKRYKIQPILINKFEEITEILTEIESRFRKRTVFISGSATQYGEMTEHAAQSLIHRISTALVKGRLNVVSGFGLGVGSAVINGALEAIYNNPKKYSDDQLILYPFPQFKTGEKELPDLWQEYREKIIGRCGISIILFGNKRNERDEVVDADGVFKEFEIAVAQGVIPVPVGITGYVARTIADVVLDDPGKYFVGNEWMKEPIAKLNTNLTEDEIVDTVLGIVKKLQE